MRRQQSEREVDIEASDKRKEERKRYEKERLERLAEKRKNRKDRLIANDLNKLLKQTGLTKEQLKSAIDLLKTLKPYPGLEFNQQESEYQVPDVVVSKKDLQKLR